MKIIKSILKSYEKLNNKLELDKEDFILTQHEIGEFNNLKDKDIIKYLVYRYKYNKYEIKC